jgi:hypothetical protein
MLNDCFRYYKGCESRQKFKNVQLAPTALLHPIIKQWSSRGWALDYAGQIYPSCLKATDLCLSLRITSQSVQKLSR